MTHVANIFNPLSRLSPLRRQRFTLVAIALIFVAPMAVAWLLLARPGWQPSYTVNHGTLIRPPRPLSAVALYRTDGAPLQADYLRGKWTLLYIGSEACPGVCQRQLYNTRQVRLAQGKNIGRVQRLLVLTGATTESELHAIRTDHPDLTVVVSRAAGRAAFLQQFRLAGATDPANAGQVYVIDPLGNLMMSYGPGASPSGMLKDLERLLKVSYVG
ncbi:MAG: SCO family protein [Gammaproteobacteria bacterium]